jgi:DNA-binding NarL/FixJ family response regulator
MAASSNPISHARSVPEQPRILVVDDHDSTRRAMRLLLEREDHFVVCGEASDGREAVDTAVRLRPDVIVMDVAMPRMNGLQAAEQMGKDLPQTPVLLISLNASEHVLPAKRGTIFGLVSKQNAAVDLPRAVHALLEGETYFQKDLKVIRGN